MLASDHAHAHTSTPAPGIPMLPDSLAAGIPAELLNRPTNPLPPFVFVIRALLSLCGPYPLSLEEPGFGVHWHPDRLDSLQRDCTPVNQIELRYLTRPDLCLLPRASLWLGSFAGVVGGYTSHLFLDSTEGSGQTDSEFQHNSAPRCVDKLQSGHKGMLNRNRDSQFTGNLFVAGLAKWICVNK